jgi:uncharacterized protein YciI
MRHLSSLRPLFVTLAAHLDRLDVVNRRTTTALVTPADTPNRTGSPTSLDISPHLDSEDVASLIYELLDAHDDTARLAATLTPDPRWAAHLDYLRALQRKGREVLAHPIVTERT